MKAKEPVKPSVLEPGEAAARLGISVPALVAIMRKYRYTFTELAVGGRPGDRGRFRWGLTEAQLAAIIRGQERGFAEVPTPAPEQSKPVPVSAGQAMLRRGRLVRP